MKLFLHIAFATIVLASCKPSGFFAKKTARENYAEKIEKQYPLEGKSWKNAGELSLNNPISTEAPYVETGYFHGDSSDAISFMFAVKAGQKINLQLEKTQIPFTAFMEMWEYTGSNSREFLHIADTLENTIEHASTEGGNYLVRLQPKIKQAGAYKFTIQLSPVLG